MAATWSKIFRQQNQGHLEVIGVRSDSNDLGTFTRNVVIYVDDSLEDTVNEYSSSELQTYLEERCDITLIDDGLLPTTLPTEDELALINPPTPQVPDDGDVVDDGD